MSDVSRDYVKGRMRELKVRPNGILMDLAGWVVGRLGWGDKLLPPLKNAKRIPVVGELSAETSEADWQRINARVKAWYEARNGRDPDAAHDV